MNHTTRLTAELHAGTVGGECKSISVERSIITAALDKFRVELKARVGLHAA